MRRGGIGRVLALGALVFLLLVGVLLSALPGPAVDARGSTLSTKETGLRAAFLLLERLGFDVETWRSAPGELVGPGELLWLDGLPPAPPRGGPREHEPSEGAELSRRSRDLGHYRRFVEAGGVLLVPALYDVQLQLLRDVLGREKLEFELEDVSDERPATLTVGLAGEWMPLSDAAVQWAFAEGGSGEDLVVDREGAVLGRRFPIGNGALVLLTVGTTVFDNEHVEREENALFLVRLLEATASGRRILFDETPFGGWKPPSVVSLAFSPSNWVFSAHLVVLFLLLVWNASWAGPFPRDPEALATVSALQRARGLADTLAGAGRWDVLAGILRAGTLERWCVRRGLRRNPRDSDRAMNREAEDARLATLARGDDALLARARAAFFTRTVEDEEGLEELATELGEVERGLSGGAGERKSVRAI